MRVDLVVNAGEGCLDLVLGRFGRRLANVIDAQLGELGEVLGRVLAFLLGTKGGRLGTHRGKSLGTQLGGLCGELGGLLRGVTLLDRYDLDGRMMLARAHH